MAHPTDELEAMAQTLETYATSEVTAGRKIRANDLDQAAAMLRACKGRVRVKALEWGEECSTEFRAVSMGILYHVGFYDGSWCFLGQEYYTPEAAKAAAQADYETRILAAIEPAPDHSEWNAAIEAAAKEAKERLYPKNPQDDWTEYAKIHAAAAINVSAAIRDLKKGQTND